MPAERVSLEIKAKALHLHTLGLMSLRRGVLGGRVHKILGLYCLKFYEGRNAAIGEWCFLNQKLAYGLNPPTLFCVYKVIGHQKFDETFC